MIVGPRTMNVIPKMLKPTALMGILFVLILLVQGAFFSSASMTYSMGGDVPDKAESSYGIGSPITATTVNGTTNSDIKWLALVGNLAACYLLAATLSKGFAGATRFRRPAIAYGIVALVMILVSFCVSIGISRSYWGYFFTRPPVLSEVNDVASVVAVVGAANTRTNRETGNITTSSRRLSDIPFRSLPQRASNHQWTSLQ